MKFLFIFLTFLAIDCSNKDIIADQDLEKKALEILATEVKSMADASVCSDQFVCDFIGFGSKPCGGNWGYLVYSSSIDVTEFLNKVKKYNTLEMNYNSKYGIISDCMVAMPPNKVICDSGKCKAVYN